MKKIHNSNIIKIIELKDGSSVFNYADKYHLQDYIIDNVSSVTDSNCVRPYAYGVETSDGKHHILKTYTDIDNFNKIY